MKLLSDLLDIITNISWTADIVGMLVALVIGFIWYHPLIFGTAWVRLTGLTKEQLENTKAKQAMFWCIPILLLIAANITAFCKHFNYTTAPKTFLIGYDLGLIIILMMAVHNLYEQRSWKLYAINAGFTLVSLSAMGVVIGVVL